MENLPIEILENIISRLPIKAALHAQQVCTTWRAILRTKTEKPGIFFAFCNEVENLRKIYDDTWKIEFFYEPEYDHYDHAKINYYYYHKTLSKIRHGRFLTKSYPTNIMVGSCNGLVCFGKDDKHVAGTDPFLICNPLTGESVLLPEYNYSGLPRDISSSTPQRIPYGRLTGGFGYCPSTNKYKVVTIYYHREEHKGHVQVYTVGSGWRYLGFIDRYNLEYCSGIYVNGALHWLSKSDLKVQKSEIVAFDLEGEKFRSIPLPHFEHKASISRLMLLGGNNKLYLVHENYKASSYDIWVYKRNNMNGGATSCAMKERNQKRKYHGKRSLHWNKEFCIRCVYEKAYECFKPFWHFTPFAITRSNEILLWYKHRSPFETGLYCYDPKTSALKELWDDKAWGMKCWYIEAIPHKRSIVSLKELGEKNVDSLKNLEKLMLQVNSNDSEEETVEDCCSTSTTISSTKKVKTEGEEKPARLKGAKRLKIC